MISKQVIIDYITRHSGLSEKSKNRDLVLDYAKGVAIILVVLGHTLQGRIQNFDEFIGFRFIYSFHMPLFALLAGGAAAFWVKKYDAADSLKELITSSVIRIKRSAEYLLLPFISWTLISYWLNHNPEPLADYLWKVFHRPDYSLWFLPCIFWCTVYAVIIAFGISLARMQIGKTRLKRLSSCLGWLPVQALLMLIAWNLILPELPPDAGLMFANYFDGGLFVFYLIGLAFFQRFVNINNFWVRMVPYILFFTLVPFWHRTLPHNIMGNAPGFLRDTWLVNQYALVVAVTGSLVFIDLSRMLYSLGDKLIDVPMLYIGRASLGIYVVHYYFLGVWPTVIAAIVVSLFVYQTTMLVPVARKVLFGK